jgi:hypothetical protein
MSETYFVLEKDFPKDTDAQYTVDGPFTSMKAVREFLKKEIEESFKNWEFKSGTSLMTVGEEYGGNKIILKVVEEVHPVVKVKVSSCLRKITKKNR